MMTRREQENFQLIVITHDEKFAHLIGTRCAPPCPPMANVVARAPVGCRSATPQLAFTAEGLAEGAIPLRG